MRDTDGLFLLRPSRTVGLLSAVALVLVGAGAAVVGYHYVLGRSDLRWFTGYFDLGDEANLPTYFSSGILLLAAGLLAWIARVQRRREAPFARHWLALALVFAFLSVDEAAMLHEFVYKAIMAVWGRGSGVFYHVWVVPFLIGVLALGVVYARFLLHLPPRYRRLFVAAAAIYVGGALGLEMVEGALLDAQGEKGLVYEVFIVIEEAMEMGGVLVFVYALLHYIGAHLTDVRVRVELPEAVAERLG